VKDLKKSRIIKFSKLLQVYDNFFFYRSLCANCQNGNLIGKIRDNLELNQKSVVILSQFNNENYINSHVRNINFGSFNLFIADSSLNYLFDIAANPAIYINKNK